MQTKVEGLVLRKAPYKDRHAVCRLLLRNGRILNTIFYGGRGGGPQKKSSVVEVGHMLRLEMQRSKEGTELYSAKEWSPIWMGENIRSHYQSYYAACFMMECVAVNSMEENLHDKFREENADEGLFRVLSNGLYYLDKFGLTPDISHWHHLMSFLGKLVYELGILPELHTCVLSGHQLSATSKVGLMADKGGFAYLELMESGRHKPEGHIRRFLEQVPATAYPDLLKSKMDREAVKSLFYFYCFQFQMRPEQFKSWSVL